MFFYTSFLRPPPCISDGTITITPQVANDLRTSYPEDARDVFYAWSPSLNDFGTSGPASAAQKLTTWRKSSMYKSLTVPLPVYSGVGQEWRLALSASENRCFVTPLAEQPFGREPLPVISMPVQLKTKGRKTVSLAKQDHIERLYSILGPEKQNTLLCIREQTSFGLDKKIWDSGLGLSSWLTNVMVAGPASDPFIRGLRSMLTSRQQNGNLRVLELGSGTGIVSICLTSLLEKFHNAQDAQVFATDLPSAIDLIEHNIRSNKTAYPTVSIEALTLDWEAQTLSPPAQGPIDLLVMADVTYNTASFPALVRTLNALIKSSQTSFRSLTPIVLLAYKQRDPTERELWSMLHDIGIDLNCVDIVNGAGGDAVEIWIWNEYADKT